MAEGTEHRLWKVILFLFGKYENEWSMLVVLQLKNKTDRNWHPQPVI